jgi:hypothetical protein
VVIGILASLLVDALHRHRVSPQVGAIIAIRQRVIDYQPVPPTAAVDRVS